MYFDSPRVLSVISDDSLGWKNVICLSKKSLSCESPLTSSLFTTHKMLWNKLCF